MHDLPTGPAPAVVPARAIRPGDAGRLAAVLGPGLHAAFDGCLSETLPAGLAELVGRLDRPGALSDGARTGASRTMRHHQRPGGVPDRRAVGQSSGVPDSFERP
jgi:hypothetical protein